MKTDIVSAAKGERIVEVPLHEFDYIVITLFSDDVDKSRSGRDALFGETWEHTDSLGITEAFDDGYSIMFLPHDCTPGLVAHECFHALWNLYSRIGAKFENEISAHMLGYLTEEIYSRRK